LQQGPQRGTEVVRENIKLPEAPGFFSSIVDKRKSSQAVLSVFFRQTDACIATSEAYEP